jgi:hypothetical protein
MSLVPGKLLTNKFKEFVPMKKSIHREVLIASLALTGLGLAQAQSTPPAQNTVQTQLQEQLQSRDTIYHGELLSEQERNAYLERLRLAKTEQEREQIRQEHREKMDLRLRALKQNREATPVAPGAGQGQGQGSGVIILPKPGGARH